MVSQVLLDPARCGVEAAFAELAAPYRQELHVHCYRMTGSFDDAEMGGSRAPLSRATARNPRGGPLPHPG